MDATYSRRRRQRRMGMRMRKNLPTIVVLWHVMLSLCTRRSCLAYTTSPPIIMARTRKETFDFRSTRRGVFGQARPHRRSTRMTLKKTRMTRMTTKNDDDDKPVSGFAEEGTRDPSSRYDDWLFDDRRQRVAFYGSLAFLETIFWYCLAPGIDPQSRWFNPLDGKLIASLLQPSTVFSPQAGSGLGFSSLLLNTFLILPMVWSLLLLQEQEENNDSNSGHFNDSVPRSFASSITTAIRTCVCAGGFLVGGGILIPYMIFRRPMPFRRSIDPEKFPAPLRLFEGQNQHRTSVSNPIVPLIEPMMGQVLLLALASVVVISFLLPFANHYCYWTVEWNAFLDRAHSSQFTALALYDFTMISIAVLDPMMDDAIRRGYVIGWENENNGSDDDNCAVSDPDVSSSARSYYRDANRDRWRSEKRTNALRMLAPYVAIPLVGPVAWICLRPRYNDMGPGE
jgi:hypothetical protein